MSDFYNIITKKLASFILNLQKNERVVNFATPAAAQCFHPSMPVFRNKTLCPQRLFCYSPFFSQLQSWRGFPSCFLLIYIDSVIILSLSNIPYLHFIVLFGKAATEPGNQNTPFIEKRSGNPLPLFLLQRNTIPTGYHNIIKITIMSLKKYITIFGLSNGSHTYKEVILFSATPPESEPLCVQTGRCYQ